MKLAAFGADYSCDYFSLPFEPDISLENKGGFDGDHSIVFTRLLEHAGFSPGGRCVIVPDTVRWSRENLKPFVCDYNMAAQRIAELDCLFNQLHDVYI